MIKEFDPFIFGNIATQIVYLKYANRMLEKMSYWVVLQNKPHSAPIGEDDLELASQ